MNETPLDRVGELLTRALDNPDPPAADPEPVSVFFCGSPSTAPVCQTPHCLGKTTAECAFPTPKGKAATCGRRLCDRCRETIHKVTYCGPHARLIRTQNRPKGAP